jgi:hypothetical protein
MTYSFAIDANAISADPIRAVRTPTDMAER